MSEKCCIFRAGRPRMRVVQALYWMQDIMAEGDGRKAVEDTLRKLFADPKHGKELRDDLRAGLSAMPIWMQDFLNAVNFGKAPVQRKMTIR